MRKPSGLMRCSWQPVLAESRMRLPVFGGISGSKTTTWNMRARSGLEPDGPGSILQPESDGHRRVSGVAVTLECHVAAHLHASHVKLRKAAALLELDQRGVAFLLVHPDVHHHAPLLVAPLGAG